MRGRWNGGYIGPQQTPTAGSVRGIFNAAEMQQLSGASLWPQPANDPYFQYVTALLQGNGGAPTSVSGTNTTNFNADASTNNFLLALNGDVRNDEFHPYQEGYYSNFFDGTGDYLTIGDNAAFEMTGDFTIETWFRPTSTATDYQAIISKSASGIYAPYIFYYRGTLGTVQFSSSTDGASYNLANYVSLGSVTLNTWNHIAVSRSGSNVRLFLNGALITTITNSSALTDNNNSVGIGGRSDGTELLTGYISNTRIVKGQGLYTAAFTPSTTPLTTTSQGATAGNVSLLTCQSNRIIDNGRGASITRNGDVSVQYFQPFGQSAISSATFTNNQPSPGTNGYYGVYFDGNGDYLQMAANVAFQYGTGDYTVEAWVYMTAVNANGSNIFAQSASGHAYFTLSVSPDGTTVRHYVNASGFATFYSSPSTFTLNTWYHVAAVRSGGTVTVYLNGVGGSSGSNNTNLNNSTYTPRIGSEVQATIETFTGYISNLRLVKGTALYTSNFTPSTTPLTAVSGTSLLTCQSSSIIDNSGNNLTITTAGNAAVTVAQPFTSTVSGSTVFSYGSAYFDGTGDFLSATANNSFAYGSGDFTVEAWIYPTKYTASIIDNRTGGSATGLFLGLVAGGNVQVYSNVQILLSPGTVPLNTWTHIALSRSSNTLYLYINGVVVTSGSNSTNYTDNNLRIGEQGGGGQPWGGYISNIRLVKGQAIYSGANFIPPNMPATVVSNTQLLSLQYNGAAMNSGFEDGGPFDFLITRNGNVSQGTFTPYGSNWSNYFDGTGDYLSINYASGSTIAGDFTWECWAYDTGATAYGTLLGWRNGSSGFSGFIIQRNNNTNNISVTINQSGGVTITQTSNTYVINQWNHVALVRSGTTVTLYVNGTSAGSGTLSGSFNPGSSYWIGSDPFNNIAATQLQGYVSNQRFVNGTAVYTSNFIPSTAPLTAITNTTLLTCQSNRFIDNSTNNFTITRNGDTSVQRFSPFRPTVAYNSATYSGSAYFDGTGDWLEIPYNGAFDLSTGNWTVECWWYPTAVANQTVVMINYVGGDGYAQARIAPTSGGAFAILSASGATTWINTTSIGSYTTGQWYHLAYVRNGSTFSLYVNGALAGSYTSASNLQSGTGVSAVGRTSSSISSFNYASGYVTDVRVSKGQAVYTAAFTPPTAPLAPTANTSLLLNMTNAGQYDNAMMNSLESVGNTQSTAAQKKYGAASLYFDGTTDCLFSPTSTNYGYGTGDFTIEFWLYLNATTQQTIVSNLAAAASTAPHIYYQSGSGIRYYTASADRITGGSLATGQWYHIAVCRGSGTTRMFINGVQTGSSYTDANNYGTSNPLGVGDYGTTLSGTSTLNGYIDDLRITKGIARYTANFTPPTSQFVNT